MSDTGSDRRTEASDGEGRRQGLPEAQRVRLDRQQLVVQGGGPGSRPQPEAQARLIEAKARLEEALINDRAANTLVEDGFALFRLEVCLGCVEDRHPQVLWQLTPHRNNIVGDRVGDVEDDDLLAFAVNLTDEFHR